MTQRRQLSAVAAVSSTRAWAVGGRGVAIRTTDGGAHWVSQPTRTTAGLLDVCFYNGSRGWASGDKGTILRTVDGGRHWLRAPTGRHDAIVKVVFADASRGLALTAPRAGRAAVLRTVDGGRTWSLSKLPSSGDLPTAVALEASGHAVVLARSGSTNATHVWKSVDAGLTWQAGPDLPVTDIYNDVAYEGLMLCAVGSSGVVVMSDDDAASWSVEGRPAGQHVSDLCPARRRRSGHDRRREWRGADEKSRARRGVPRLPCGLRLGPALQPRATGQGSPA